MRPTIQMSFSLLAASSALLLTASCNGAGDHPLIANGPDPIMAWQVAGPYRAEDTTAAELLDRIFLPEDEPDHPAVFWIDHYATNADDPGRFDLSGLRNPARCVAYARTSIWSDAAREAALLVDADDGHRLWINKQPASADDGGVHLINLDAGWNEILLKLAQDKGGWAFATAISATNGTSLANIRIDPMRRPTAPPADAVVLFDGTSLDGWHRAGRASEPAGWHMDGDAMVVRPGSGSIQSKATFEDFTLHIEFMCPDGIAPNITGQARSNSGVYLHGSYEVQVLDSYGQPPRINEVGAIYNVRSPNVNAARRPGQWQTYDIEFISPRFDDAGNKVSDARLTVFHNGVLIHRDVQVTGPTGAGQAQRPGPGPIMLQDHGNAVRYRNIWVVPHTSWDGADAPGYTKLVHGSSKRGWTKRGGDAVYTVAGGVVTGETRPNTPNTFLCTNESYRDFILELEYKVDDELNSGVQIRSNSLPMYQNRRVHGYQVEIDPSDRSWSAGIYDEARRGWLADLKDHAHARTAYRAGDWNRLRVIARGDMFRTYLNNVPVALLNDGCTAEGFIGLQVHGVGGREDRLRVQWRDIRIRTLE